MTRGNFRNTNSYRDEIGDAIALQQTGAGVSRNNTESTVDYLTSANTSDYMYANVQLNHDRELTSTIYPHIHWFQALNAVPNFLLQYRWQVNGGAKTTGWTNWQCNTTAFSYAAGTIHQICYSAGISAAVGSTISDIVQFRIIRDTTNVSGFFGADPYGATVGVLAFDVHILLDTNGSIGEYVK